MLLATPATQRAPQQSVGSSTAFLSITALPPCWFRSVAYITVPTILAGKSRSKVKVTWTGWPAYGGATGDAVIADARMAPSEGLWKATAESFGTALLYDNWLVLEPSSTNMRLLIWLLTVPRTLTLYSLASSIVRIIRFKRN